DQGAADPRVHQSRRGGAAAEPSSRGAEGAARRGAVDRYQRWPQPLRGDAGPRRASVATGGGDRPARQRAGTDRAKPDRPERTGGPAAPDLTRLGTGSSGPDPVLNSGRTGYL